MSAPVNADAGRLFGLSLGGIISDPAFPGVLADPFDRTTGLGDLAYIGVLSPKKPIKIEATGGLLVWGVGMTSMFPTATEDVLGLGKYSLGPALVTAYLGQDWTLGLFPQPWWSVGGDSKRADVTITNIQYFIYRSILGEAQWRIGMSPNITINWNAKGDNRLTLPVGLGAGRLVKLGKLPTRISVEVQYAVVHPDDVAGTRWNFRLYFVPVIPTFLF